MNPSNVQIVLTFRYVFMVFLAVLATWIMHEFAHWCAGTMLGHDMVMTLNSCYPVTGKYREPWHGNIISIAGPFITMVQAVCIYFLLKRGNITLFPFLFVPLYMRGLAGAMNLINLNDEGRVSQALGLGVFTIPLLVFVTLLYLTVEVVRKQKLSTRLMVTTILLTMLFSSVLILADQFSGITIIGK